MKGSMIINTAQKETLEAFFRSTLLDGSLPFEFPNQEGAGTLLVREGEQPPSISSLGAGWWQVVLDLEVLP